MMKKIFMLTCVLLLVAGKGVLATGDGIVIFSTIVPVNPGTGSNNDDDDDPPPTLPPTLPSPLSNGVVQVIMEQNSITVTCVIENVTVQVTNAASGTVYRSKITGNNLVIDTRNWDTGNYTIVLMLE